MRQYAYLREPLPREDGPAVVKIMLCQAEEGCYLFGYASVEANLCCFDLCYASPEELYEDWNGLIDERGWLALDDPLPGCQQDAFIPLRVKGRDGGRPEWGVYETLREGQWVPWLP